MIRWFINSSSYIKILSFFYTTLGILTASIFFLASRNKIRADEQNILNVYRLKEYEDYQKAYLAHLQRKTIQ